MSLENKQTKTKSINFKVMNNQEINEIKNVEGLCYLESLNNESINLVLTDPPYITSRKTGMDEQAKIVQKYSESKQNIKSEEDWKKFKTDEEWEKWMTKNNITDEKKKKKELEKLKNNYLKFGSIYGKKYAVVTDYGDWDNNFTMELLEKFITHYFRVLKNGGTVIIFFDIWKITHLKEIMENVGFKQIRFIEWIKTNPQPLNSSTNYLTNCREIALLGVKKSKPTFNSKYDNAIYKYPLQGGKNRFHPTQKSLCLFEELIKKHSNENDVVLDTFLGSGTTAIASKNTNRNYKGCEISKEYYDKIIKLLE
jgi:DNA modification methylase